MKRPLLILVAFVMLIASCKKENDDSQPFSETIYSSYLPLKIGNYWVYEWFNTDTNNITEPMNKFDSIYISMDTLIHYNTFYKMEGTMLGSMSYVQFVRDSLHYLVNSAGTVLFSSEDFTNILYVQDTVADLFYSTCKMEDKDVEINVAAGNFFTYDYRQTIHHLDNNYHWGERANHNRYAKDVGRVLFTNFYYSSPNYMEARLIKYSVEE